MRRGAIFGAVFSFLVCIIWLTVGVNEAITTPQAILCGLMLATFVLCIANIEK